MGGGVEKADLYEYGSRISQLGSRRAGLEGDIDFAEMVSRIDLRGEIGITEL